MQTTLTSLNKDGTCTICGKSIETDSIVLKWGGTTFCSQKCVENAMKSIEKWVDAFKSLQIK